MIPIASWRRWQSCRTAQNKLRIDLTALQDGQNKLRTDLMARMDRHQARLDNIDDHLAMDLGYSDRVHRWASAGSEDSRILGKQLMTLTHVVRRLEARVNQLEEKPPY